MRLNRQHEEEYENHERWVISYADFITLLFAFFVVMYAMSSVNEGKYKVLSSTLQDAFNQTPKSMRPIEVGPSVGYGGYDPNQVIDLPFPRFIEEPQPEKEEEKAGILGGGSEELMQIAGEIRSSFPELLKKELINLGENDNWLEIEINNKLLFQSGDATPNPDAISLIMRLAEPLKNVTLPINIEGFTDNVPIKNDRYPSNWELSAARAAAIVRILASNEIDARRLAAIGYGEFKPVASNSTEEGRQRNRRVVMLISKPTNRFEESKDGTLMVKPGSPDGPIAPVRLPGGGLLFTADPPAEAEPTQGIQESEPAELNMEEVE